MTARGRAAVFLGGVAAFAVFAGCAPWSCDFESHGACVEFASAPPTDLAAAKARLDRLLDLELPFWGLSSLKGWRIQYRDGAEYPCYLAERNAGCTDYIEKTMSVRLPTGSGHACFEAAELLHELGHYELGDPLHSNPRWQDIEEQFARIVWDRPDAAPECVARYKGITSGMWLVNRNGF